MVVNDCGRPHPNRAAVRRTVATALRTTAPTAPTTLADDRPCRVDIARIPRYRYSPTGARVRENPKPVRSRCSRRADNGSPSRFFGFFPPTENVHRHSARIVPHTRNRLRWLFSAADRSCPAPHSCRGRRPCKRTPNSPILRCCI